MPPWPDERRRTVPTGEAQRAPLQWERMVVRQTWPVFLFGSNIGYFSDEGAPEPERWGIAG